MIVTFKPSPSFPDQFIQKLLYHINTVRSSPSSYISYLDLYTDYPLQDRLETASFLQRQQSVGPLSINPLLNELSQSHVIEQSRTGDIGHGDLRSRLNIPIASPSYAIAENISYGLSDPIDIIIAWIVDYGVQNKGHRYNLFRSDLDQIGIGYGYHPTYRTMVVNNYARGFATQR